MSESPFESYCRIGTSLVHQVLELLLDGEQVALLGTRRGGKSLILSEVQMEVATLPELDRPRIVFLIARNFRYRSEEEFFASLAKSLEVPRPEKTPSGARISGIIQQLLLQALAADRRSLWIFVKDLLELPTPLARGMLEAFQTAAQDREFGRRVSAAVTGGLDFVPLTYGEISPYRHAKRFLLLGFERHHAGLFFARRRICQRTGGKVAERAGFESVDVSQEIDEDALDYLFDQTGGNAHLLQQIVMQTPSYPRPPGIEETERRWTLPQTKIFVEHFVEAHMADDFHVRMALRDVETDSPAFDLMLEIRRQGNGKVAISDPRPHTLELAGLAYRDAQGFGSIACPLWQRYLDSVLSACHVADVYAHQRRWEEAWDAYSEVPGLHRARPLSGDSARRLHLVLVDWQDSFVDRISNGPDAVCQQFFHGADSLLGFEVGAIYDKSKQPPTVLYEARNILFSPSFHIPSSAEAPVRCGTRGHRYWLDGTRQRLFSDPDIDPSSPLNIHPVLFLERFGMERPIDEAEQKHVGQVLSRFWSAYLRAHEIQYAKGIGRLRERHLKVIQRVNSLLVEEPFDMGRVVRATAEALVQEAGYYRIMICLVDAKGENIEAVAGCCVDRQMNFNYPTNFPLESSKPMEEWDIQPWVVKKGQLCVVEDASSPAQRNPTTQWRYCTPLEMKAIVVVPMKIGDKVLGTIHFERDDEAVPSAEEQELFRIFAGQLAVAFHQGQRLTLLQESVMQLRDEIRILDPCGRIVFLNPSAAVREAGLVAGWQSKAALSACATATADRDHLIERVDRSGKLARHYHFFHKDDQMSASVRLVAPVEDFRTSLPAPYSDAHGRIGYVERLHDLTELYEMYASLQDWLRTPGIQDTAAAVLHFYERQHYRWCRLYLRETRASGLEELVSFHEFGLTQAAHIEAFRGGEIRFPRNAENVQPWHAIDVVGGPAIYEWKTDVEHYVEAAEPWNGFPRYWSKVVECMEELEKCVGERWIEAPLLLGNEVIGKFSLSVPEDLRAEQWELLKSTILGVAVALRNARRIEEEARRAVEDTWKMAAAQAVHQLGNKLTSTASWLHYALRDLDTHTLAEARTDISLAANDVDGARAILRDYRRYASDKPFKDAAPCSISRLLDRIVGEIRKKHPKITLVQQDAHISEVTVEVSIDAMLEVFEILVDNSLLHSGLSKDDLRLEVCAELALGRVPEHVTNLPMVCLKYTDNGQGIPEHDRDRVFKPFYSTHERGTGLGLSIARQNIHRHRGEMVVGDNAETGACLLIYLPILRAR